jgi:hypothetical protein
LNLIKLFRSEPSIRKCPICKNYPTWDCWEVIPDECIELWALRCEGMGVHYYSTSYWRDKNQAIFQWNRLCDKVEKQLTEMGDDE